MYEGKKCYSSSRTTLGEEAVVNSYTITSKSKSTNKIEGVLISAEYKYLNLVVKVGVSDFLEAMQLQRLVDNRLTPAEGGDDKAGTCAPPQVKFKSGRQSWIRSRA